MNRHRLNKILSSQGVTPRVPFSDTTNRVRHRTLASARRTLNTAKYLPRSATPLQSPTKQLNDILQGDIKQYTLGKIIGQGAYAIVRQSIHEPTQKTVAIKSYDKLRLKQTHRRRNLRKEIQVMKQIQHPNIVKFYDAIKSARHINIVMQLTTGLSLHAYLKSRLNRRLSQSEIKRIFKQIVQAVAYLHDKEISHRDLKLQNILLDNQQNPKLIDFGFSTIERRKYKVFCGTPSYMAPQIVNRREFLGEPADIWALGVILFVVSTGVFPFRASSDRELYRKIASGVKDIPEVAPKAVRSLIRHMLNVHPEGRPSAREILAHTWFNQCMEKDY